MTRAIPAVRRAAPVQRSLIGFAAILLAACGGAASTVPPTAGLPTPSVGVSVDATVAVTPVPAATIPPVSTAPAVTAVPEATPPVTEPPVTGPPPTAPPVTEPPATQPPPSLAPGIGVKLQIGDQQLMTVEAAEQWPGAGTVKPKKGKVFFTVSIRIDAIKLTSFDSADFKLKDAAGKSYAWRTGRAPHLYDLANMTPGGTYLGWITYEIPKASLGKLTLIYKPAFLGGTTFQVPLF